MSDGSTAKEIFSPTKIRDERCEQSANIIGISAFSRKFGLLEDPEFVEKCWDNNNFEAGKEKFVNCLKDLFDCPELKLLYIRELSMLFLEFPDGRQTTLSALPASYFRILALIMRILCFIQERSPFCNSILSVDYNYPVTVFIDDVDMHLDLRMQKEVLPFLTELFPNIQFIVSTHSPFVINSLENAVVYDLSRKIRADDLYYYSYESIVEVFLQNTQYSKKAIESFGRYKELYHKERTPDEAKEFFKLICKFRAIPTYAAPQLLNAFYEMEISRKLGNIKNKEPQNT